MTAHQIGQLMILVPCVIVFLVVTIAFFIEEPWVMTCVLGLLAYVMVAAYLIL